MSSSSIFSSLRDVEGGGFLFSFFGDVVIW